MSKEKVTVTGQVLIVLKGPDGEVKKELLVKNLVTTVGKTELAKLLAESTNFGRPTHIAVGTDNTAPDVADTTLGAQLASKPVDSTIQTTNKVTYAVSFAAGEATGVLEEAGLIDNVHLIMWARFLTGSFNKGANDTMEISWALLFT